MKFDLSTMEYRRRNAVAVTVMLMLTVIGVRFFQYQVIYHERYAATAESNSIRTVRLPAPRGIILDRNGNFLVTNQPQYSLAVIPAEVRKTVDNLVGVSRYLNLTMDEIKTIVDDSYGIYRRFQPVILATNVSFPQRSLIEEHLLEFPGVFFIDESIRHYPSRARAAHIIGYLRIIAHEQFAEYQRDGYRIGDQVGYAGLERYLESTLRGTDGYRYRLVDNLLRDLGDIPYKPMERPIPGVEVTLSIDIEMQARAELLMENKRGALIALDPKTGEIYASASAPDYGLAPFVGSIPTTLWEQWRNHPDKLLLNRAVNGLYPPGSIFKLVAAAAAMARSDIDPMETIECTGVYRYGNRDFHCNTYTGHGLVDMETALKVSCNIYFYQLIQKIGFADWVAMSHKFGFGSPTGIDLPSESAGLIPTPEFMDKKYAATGWTAGHMLNLVLGQGDVLVTPMQIARMTAAIANGGRLVIPHFVIAPAREDAVDTPLIELPPWIWNDLQKAMYQVVNGEKGTGFRARLPGVRVYGKTGTAENPGVDGHSWFTGFYRGRSNREIVVTVVVEEGGLGSRVATPIAADMFALFRDRYDRPEQDFAQVH